MYLREAWWQGRRIVHWTGENSETVLNINRSPFLVMGSWCHIYIYIYINRKSTCRLPIYIYIYIYIYKYICLASGAHDEKWAPDGILKGKINHVLKKVWKRFWDVFDSAIWLQVIYKYSWMHSSIFYSLSMT